MKIAIPKSQLEGFKEFLTLSDEQWKPLLEALAAAGPTISARTLARNISSNTDLNVEQLRRLIVMAGSLYVTRDHRGVGLEEFAQAVADAAVNSGLLPNETSALIRVKQRLCQLLSLDNSLGVSAKATQLLLRHKNPLSTARIFTDIRPIFVGDASPAPRAAVVVHTLELVTNTDGRELSHYISLDNTDLDMLKRVVDRAISKEASLKAMMASLPLVEIKELEED